MTELIWDGKYDKNGKKTAPVRIELPLYHEDNETQGNVRIGFSELPGVIGFTGSPDRSCQCKGIQGRFRINLVCAKKSYFHDRQIRTSSETFIKKPAERPHLVRTSTLVATSRAADSQLPVHPTKAHRLLYCGFLLPGAGFDHRSGWVHTRTFRDKGTRQTTRCFFERIWAIGLEISR